MVIAVRPARTDDCDDIVSVFHDCWHISYADILPPSLVETMTWSRSERLWQSILPADRGKDSCSVLVAERRAAGGRSIIVGVTRVSVENDGVGTVESLYVSPSSQKEGAGRLLLGAAGTRLTELKACPMRLWVFAANTSSLAFYWSQGWRPNGHSRIQDEFGVPELQLQFAGLRPASIGDGVPGLGSRRRLGPPSPESPGGGL